MLKIKDNVDLKELELLGFKLSKNYGAEVYKNRLKSTGGICWLMIMPVSRELRIDTSSTMYILEIDVIYDLIQAGYVEKVEEW